MAINKEIYDIEKISRGRYGIWKIYERTVLQQDKPSSIRRQNNGKLSRH